MKRICVFIALLFISINSLAEFDCDPLSQCYRKWFVLFYLGKMTNDNLGQVLVFDYSLDNSSLYSFELGKELGPCNPFRAFFQPVVSTVDIRGNLTLLTDSYGPIYEFNPYFALNWCEFPWCRTIKTTISFGEGLSYVTKIPAST